MSFSTDVALLSRLCCQTGNESDWQLFYLNYQGLIQKWCRQQGVSPDDLEDVFHDILIKLVVSLPQYDETSANRFRGWLKTVVVNALIDRMRMAQKHPAPKLVNDFQLVNSISFTDNVEAGLSRLADQLVLESTSAAKILNAVRQRVNEKTWDTFVRRELLAEEVSVIATDL